MKENGLFIGGEALPPTRVVSMNCSIVYCFTGLPGLGEALLFASGVALVSNALSEISGRSSGEGRCASIVAGRERKKSQMKRRNTVFIIWFREEFMTQLAY